MRLRVIWTRPERRDLGDLVARTVTAEALDETAQHELTVALEDHVDEVDDDDAADVAQAKLAYDLFGSFEVVLGDGLFEVAARTGVLAGVDVDDRHGFRTVDDERSARRQEHLALERLVDLLIEPVGRERVLVGVARSA